MRAAERGHWWYVGLRAMLGHFLREAAPGPTPAILDAGCGTGGNLRLARALFPAAALTGLDFSAASLAALEPGLCEVVYCADLNQQPDVGGPFEVIVCCDVLSHRGVRWPEALGWFQTLLRPGGSLLVNVPAFPSLRGRHDEAVLTAHRFTRAELREAAGQAGFGELRLHFWNAALLPALFLSRRLGRGAGEPRSDLEVPPWNTALARWIRWETRLACRRPLPFGTSLFLRASRPA